MVWWRKEVEFTIGHGVAGNKTDLAGVQESTIGAAEARGRRSRKKHRAAPRKEMTMKAVVERCAGIDLAKKALNVCLMTGAADQAPEVELRLFGSFNGEFETQASGMVDREGRIDVLPTWDVKWRVRTEILTGSASYGQRSPRAIRDLRDLTRRRRQLIGDATSERNRVQKVLEEANVKLGSVLSDIFGVSGQLMLEKLLDGEPDPEAIANLAQRRARMKIPEILQSLEGNRLRDHHRRMLRLSLEHLAFLEQQIGTIDGEVLALIEREGYGRWFDLLQSIPGVQEISAAALLAETRADMSVFPTEEQLSSWIGVCPGNRISAGKIAARLLAAATGGHARRWWSALGQPPQRRIAI